MGHFVLHAARLDPPKSLRARRTAAVVIVIVLFAVALSLGGQSVAWAENDDKFPMVEVEAIDEWRELLAMNLIDVAELKRAKAPCIVWDRTRRRVVWRSEGVAFPHFVSDGREVLGIRAGRILVWHDTKTGKELRRQRIALPKEWGGTKFDDQWWTQVKNLALLADKKDVIVIVHRRLFRHRLADGKTFFQPDDEKTDIDMKDGFVWLTPRTIRTSKSVQDRFVTPTHHSFHASFESDRGDETSAEFVLWNARTLRPIRRWAPPSKGRDSPRAVAITADGRLVAGMIYRIGEVRAKDVSWCVVWDTTTGMVVHNPLWKANIPDLSLWGTGVLAFSDDSKLLASLTRADQVGVFDVRSGHRIETLKLPNNGIKDPHYRPTPSLLRFSADGERLYVGTINGGVFIWDDPGKQPTANRKPSQIIPLDKLMNK